MESVVFVLAFISALLGAFTFQEASECAAKKRDYSALRISVPLLLGGVFVGAFVLYGLLWALVATVVAAIALEVIYTLISHKNVIEDITCAKESEAARMVAARTKAETNAVDEIANDSTAANTAAPTCAIEEISIANNKREEIIPAQE